MTPYNAAIAQGGSSFSAVEGRCLAGNVKTYNNTGFTFDYGQQDMGTTYKMFWIAIGY